MGDNDNDDDNDNYNGNDNDDDAKTMMITMTKKKSKTKITYPVQRYRLSYNKKKTITLGTHHCLNTGRQGRAEGASTYEKGAKQRLREAKTGPDGPKT